MNISILAFERVPVFNSLNMAKTIACLILMLIGRELFAQGSKVSVSVKIDSLAESFQLRNFICDSFTCIFQGDKFLFYEKSYRVGMIDLYTGEIIEVKHLPPDKILVERDRLISYNKFNNKMVSMESSRVANPRIPFQMFGKFSFQKFLFTEETKSVAGVLCKKGWSLGDTGDSTIIWVPKDTAINYLKSIFNFLFIKPPIIPVMEITFKNFRMTDAIVEELSYAIYAFEIGDFSRDFQGLRDYKRVTQEEFVLERDATVNAVYEQYKKEKGKKQ